MIILHIPLPPVSWLAPIKGRFHFYDPRERDKRCARLCISRQYSKDPIDDYVAVAMKYLFKPPESASKKKKQEMLEGKIFPTRIDCTNMQKLYEDCLKGIVIKDDRKVVKIFSEKLYGEKEEVFIKVFTLDEFNANFS